MKWRVQLALACALLLSAWVLTAQAQDSGPSQYWFEVDAVNPGLGEPPPGLARETPQETLEKFLINYRQADWPDAAHFLDLSGIDRNRQGERGPELARQLGAVIERKLWIDWGDVPDRPDAVSETGSRNDPLAGKPRRSLRLAIVEMAGRPVSIRLNRIKPKDGDAVWLFSAQTVENVPDLFEIHGPGWFERMLPRDWLAQSWLSLRKWEWAALPLLLLALIVLFLLMRLIAGWVVAAMPWSWAKEAARKARMPLALVVTSGVALFVIGTAFTFSAPVTTILVPILIALLVTGIAMAALRIIDAALDVVTERYVDDIDDADSQQDREFYTQIYAIRRLVLLVAVVVGLGFILSELHLFDSLGLSLLASAGVVTVLLGIAAQATLGNIFSSLQIAFAKPIRIGDSVLYEGNWAYVEAIFYTFVRLRTWDERRLIVPVKYFVSNPFENWSVKDPTMVRPFRLLLDHNADAEKLREVFEEMANNDEDVLKDQMLKMLVVDHSQHGQTLQFYATASDPSTAWGMHARLRENMLAWIRDNHPEWWPRERVSEPGSASGRGGAVTEAGG